MNDIDFNKLYLMPEKKGYRVSYGLKKLRVTSPSVFIPFGIETYNGKNILNLEAQKGNDQLNFVHQMNVFDKLYWQFSDKSVAENCKIPFVNLPPNFLKDIYNKTYISFLRATTQGRIIRTHVPKNVEVYKIVDGKNVPVSWEELKGKYAVCELELSNLWNFDSSYGLSWNVTKIILN